jgi:hypothetical protein
MISRDWFKATATRSVLGLISDEASAISDKIWEVSEGALTDEETEIIWLAFGNPTRNSAGSGLSARGRMTIRSARSLSRIVTRQNRRCELYFD